jgi:FkbM family methyltransferase
MSRSVGVKVLRGMWHSLPSPVKSGLATHVIGGISGVLLQSARYSVPDLSTVLRHTRSNGFSPKMIIDVGAYVGDWSRTATGIFPDARCMMIDANENNREPLKLATSQIRNSEYLITLLGPEKKTDVVFQVLGTGSSVLPELSSVARIERHLAMERLDDLMAARQVEGPTLLKLDVQGFELEVLRGASKTLAGAEIVILETSLVHCNAGAPLFFEVISFMKDAGFVVYDFCGQSRRDDDNTLVQTDVVFARVDSKLRMDRGSAQKPN